MWLDIAQSEEKMYPPNIKSILPEQQKYTVRIVKNIPPEQQIPSSYGVEAIFSYCKVTQDQWSLHFTRFSFLEAIDKAVICIDQQGVKRVFEY